MSTLHDYMEPGSPVLAVGFTCALQVEEQKKEGTAGVEPRMELHAGKEINEITGTAWNIWNT